MIKLFDLIEFEVTKRNPFKISSIICLKMYIYVKIVLVLKQVLQDESYMCSIYL